MKLTNTLRSAWVRAIMADVPDVDYTEQTQKLLQAAAYETAPLGIQNLDDGQKRRWLNECMVYTGFNYVQVFAPKHWKPIKGGETELRVAEIRQKHLEQLATFKDLVAKLQGVAASVTTVERLNTICPEFAKYLEHIPPAANTANLPALANLVADVVKAGWKP